MEEKCRLRAREGVVAGCRRAAAQEVAEGTSGMRRSYEAAAADEEGAGEERRQSWSLRATTSSVCGGGGGDGGVSGRHGYD